MSAMRPAIATARYPKQNMKPLIFQTRENQESRP
jgi:hypothetical protein